MNKIFIYFLSSLFVIHTVYHFHIRDTLIFKAKLTKGMMVLLVVIPTIFLGLAYSVGNGLMENVVLALVASLFMVSQILGRGIGEAGIYYWSNYGMNRLAKWEKIEKINFDYDKNHLEKIRFASYACYPDQYYHSEDVRKIKEYIQRRM